MDRVFRGGFWDGTARNARSAYRYPDGPANVHGEVGFRPARSLR